MTQSYLERPLRDYLDDAAAKSSTPGGGSVTALVGALATTMASMAANFTAGREKYAAVEPQVQAALASLEESREAFLLLLHRDMEVYGAVTAAYKLPRETEDEKSARSSAIQAALKKAMSVPLEVTRVAVQTLEAVQDLANIANANLLSDVAVAAILAHATFEAGRVNVEINLGSIADADLVAATTGDLDDAEQVAARLKAACLDAIKARKG